MRRTSLILAGLCALLIPRSLAAAQGRAPQGERRLAASDDAYVRELRAAGGEVRWRFGTAWVERQVQFKDGHLALLSFKNPVTQQEYVQGPSDVIRFVRDGNAVTGRSVRWVLDGVATRRLEQGELLMQLTLHTADLVLVKSYLLYPKQSVIQEWFKITNRSSRPITLDDLAVIEMHALQREVSDIDVSSMGADFSWKFQTRPLTVESADTFSTGAPILIFQNRVTQAGLFLGWDFAGALRLPVGNVRGAPGHIGFEVVYGDTLLPGDSLETPTAFTGLFHGDWDAMGQELIGYQYRYKWDYVRDAYFPRTGIEGYWAAGSSYGSAVGSTKGVFDPVATYRKVFHLADFMRTVGGELYWRDNGWWDNEGDWNGPDFGETRRYLANYGINQILYIPIQDADSKSRVAREHPDWLLPQKILDQGNPDVIAWESALLESKRRLWGDFQWRKDWGAFAGTPAKLFAQDRGYRRLIKTFLDRHPGMGYYGNNAEVGYEMIRFANSWGFAPGIPDPPAGTSGSPEAWAHQQLYWISYIFPADKLEDMPDRYNPNSYEKAYWRRLAANRMSFIGETEDPAKLEGVRELIDIRRYLTHKKVFGRWAWIYHPKVTGDSADWYLQRMSGDSLRGMIGLGHAIKSPITIYPKGLLPTTTYTVSYQESSATENRSGADLMAKGISLASVPDGEILYLNVPLHPGSPADRTAPRAPSGVTLQVATHMDHSGVELRWSPGRDDNWISYYEIYRNGVLIGTTAIGTYYFDHALGADLTAQYAVVTVDGSGNRSAPTPARKAAGPAPVVADDTSKSITYTGAGWEHRTKQWSVAYGTQSATNTQGDAVSYTFSGSEVTWYGRMGQDKGIAAVYLDGKLDRLVNTYAADEMPNIALYKRSFPGVEKHTLKIVALGVGTGVAKGAPIDEGQHWIVVDGFQVDQAPVRVVQPTAQAGVVFRGSGWRPAAAGPGEPGGTVSSQANDTASYTFTGRGITWVGRRCSQCGIADVYLDGQLVTAADTYVEPVQAGALNAEEQRHVPIFTHRWPAAGKHTLKIVTRPDMNLWAKGRGVYLEALHVDP